MCLTVGRQSRDHRPLSRDPSVTFYKKFPNCLKRPKTLFDSQPTVAWPPTTVAWPFSDFFQNFPKSLETSKKRCLTVGRRSRDLNHCRVTVQRLFSKYFPNRLKRQKTLFDSRPTVAWPRPLSRDRSATFFKIFPNRLKRPKNVVWQSADGRVTSTTVAWPFSDFFQNFPKSLETSKKRCLTVGRRSRDLNHCRVTVQRLFSKFPQIAWNVLKMLFDSRPTVAWPPTTVAWPFSDFFQNISQIAWNVQKTLFDSRPTVAWPPTTVAWPFSDFFQKISQIAWNVQKTLFDSRPTVAWPQPLLRDRSATFFKISPNRLKRPKNRSLTVGRRSRDLRPLSRDRSATFFQHISQIAWNVQISLLWQSADGSRDFSRGHCRVTVQRLFSKKFLIAWNVN